MTETAENQRIDIWLWHGRFFKTRSLSTKVCRAGRIRINGQKITKAKSPVTVGDVLTFPQANIIRIVKVTGFNHRRGPAPEARALYDDMTPAPDVIRRQAQDMVARREKGAGRPTKSERRATDRLKNIFPD